jgi:hypothetical protein
MDLTKNFRYTKSVLPPVLRIRGLTEKIENCNTDRLTLFTKTKLCGKFVIQVSRQKVPVFTTVFTTKLNNGKTLQLSINSSVKINNLKFNTKYNATLMLYSIDSRITLSTKTVKLKLEEPIIKVNGPSSNTHVYITQ